jgi:hypothetical protein
MLPPGGGAVPDYTKQLEEIIRLLSRRGISPWVLAAFAALLGVVGGAVGRAIEPLIADISRRRRLRRVLYGDLAGMFFQVDTITTFGERWANDHVRDDAFHRLSGDLDFQAEAYISANRDVFMQLRERQAANHVYRLLHRIIDDVPRNMETKLPRCAVDDRQVPSGRKPQPEVLREIPAQEPGPAADYARD